MSARAPKPNAHKCFVAGVDCSTQNTKVLVVDVDTGKVAATGKCANRVERNGPKSETHPETWWQSLGRALSQTGLAHQIKSISIAAQQLGLVTLD